jgi:hypothetical protein
MKKVTVELDWDTVDNIIQTELQSTYESMKQDLINRSEGRGYAIFHKKKSKDIDEIIEHLYCLERVMKYYGVDV